MFLLKKFSMPYADAGRRDDAAGWRASDGSVAALLTPCADTARISGGAGDVTRRAACSGTTANGPRVTVSLDALARKLYDAPFAR